MAQALSDLGLRVLHHCPLTNNLGREWSESIKADWDALASWKIIEGHQYYWRWTQPTQTIYCIRSSGWEASMDAFGFSQMEQDRLKRLADLTFRFYNSRIHTLKCEVNEATYEDLAGFLGIKTDLCGPIPHLNKLDQHFQI